MPFHWVISSWSSTNKLFATEVQYIIVVCVNCTNLSTGLLQRVPEKCIGGKVVVPKLILWRKPLAANTVLPKLSIPWNWSSSRLQLSWGLRTNKTKVIQRWQLQSFFSCFFRYTSEGFVPFISFFWVGRPLCQHGFHWLAPHGWQPVGMPWMLNWF